MITTCFKYINYLRSSELPKWIQEEIIKLAALEFRFDEKISAVHYANHLASLLEMPIPRGLILSGPRLTWEWDRTLIQETLKHLVIENSLIVVISQPPVADLGELRIAVDCVESLLRCLL